MKGQKGITLIALIITIIVMLILVIVTINMAVNGGLFANTKTASEEMQKEADKELLMSVVLDSLDDQGNLVEGTLLQLAAAKGFTKENNAFPYTFEKQDTKNRFTVDSLGNIAYVGKGGEEQGSGGGTAQQGYVSSLTLPQGVSLIGYSSLTGDLKDAADEGIISAVIQETIGGQAIQAVIPTGYTIDSTANTISGGLVIKDNYDNEFVWIPVPEKNMQLGTYLEPYVAGDDNQYTEPAELDEIYMENVSYEEDGYYEEVWDEDLEDWVEGDWVEGEWIDEWEEVGEYDSQEVISHLYGSSLSYSSDFNYLSDYAEMVTSVNTYGGFYIGRYETTIETDSQNNISIGSKADTEVLTTDKMLASLGNNPARWWGLYYLNRRANVAGNNINTVNDTKSVQTNMIWGQQFDKMIAYFENYNINHATEVPYWTLSTGNEVINSGQAQYTYDNNTIYDVIYNIYDLQGNSFDWTAEADIPQDPDCRVYRRRQL